MKNNNNQAISLQLETQDFSQANLLEFSASTMMVVMKKNILGDGATSSPASPPAW
jgi:hypothetical protein